MPDPARWSLAHLCTSQPALEEATDDTGVPTAWPHLLEVLEQCGNAAHAVSELISATYFTHSGASEQSVGA